MTIDRWAWDEYWREQLPADGACMARAPAEFHAALDRHWQAIAARFDTGAKIADLGCGRGAAGNRLAAARRDIEVVGVDFADVGRPTTATSIEIRGRVNMEHLPFPDRSLDGAVSQFGFEYCHVERGIAEVSRVLKPGSSLCLVVHHAHSPICLDNVRTDRVLRQLLSAPMKRAFTAGDQAMVRAMIVAVPAALRRDPTIHLLSSALEERLDWPVEQRAMSWDAISSALRPEIALAAALDRSAVNPLHLHQWLAPFDDAFSHINARPFNVGEHVMAWRIDAKRAR